MIETQNSAWFALVVKTRQERNTAASLRTKGFSVFLPEYRSYRRWSDRIREVNLPLFPGYVFCRFDALRRLPILTTPGVCSVVGTGRTPIPVSDDEIEALRAIVTSNLQSEPWPYLRIGQRIRIAQGPLCGLDGILPDIRNRCRLVVSVSLLQRAVAVEIDRHWALPASPESPAPQWRPACAQTVR